MEKNEPTTEEIAKYVSASDSVALSSLQPEILQRFIALGCRLWKTLESGVATPKADRYHSCRPLSNEIAVRISRLLDLSLSEVQKCWGALRPLIAQTAAKSDEPISVDYLIQRHSISIPSISYCIDKDCEFRKSPLSDSTIGNALLYTLRHGVTSIRTEMLECSNPVCFFTYYYKDYSIFRLLEIDHSRTYYSSQMPEILQVQDGVYVERDLCKWFSLTISPTCSGVKVATIYNDFAY